MVKLKKRLSLILVFTFVFQLFTVISNKVTVKAEDLPKISVLKEQTIKDDLNNTVSFNLQIKNAGLEKVDLSKVKIKYWYTSDGIDDEEAVVDYSTIDKSKILFQFSDLDAIYQNADRQLTISFGTVDTYIDPGSSQYINLRFYSKQWKTLKQSNDYSCINNVTTYYEDKLTDGVEPSYVQARENIIKFDVKAYNKALDSNPSIYPCIKVKNVGNVKLDISKIKFRYYYTKDGDDDLAEVYYCDWCNIGNDKVTGTLNLAEKPTENYDHYLEVAFKDTPGILNVNDELEVQSRFNKPNWKPYNQQNDYSFDSTDTQYANWDKVEVIYDGQAYSGGIVDPNNSGNSGSDSDDIDSDGLPNYYELTNTRTDPQKADSDNTGINDGQKDNDHDGLTNLEEYKLGTDPGAIDTDCDGLSDLDEVDKYHTNPAIYDSDADGMGDGAEVKNGLDPLNKDTDGDGIIDSQEVFNQVLIDSVYKNVDIQKSLVAPEVVIKGSGDYSKQIHINDVSDNKTFSSINSIVGHPFEFAHNDNLKFESAKLSFKISDTALQHHKLSDLKIAWYDTAINKVNLLDTQIDETSKTISTDVNHFSYYFVIDSKDYYYDIDVVNANSKIDTGKADVVFTIDTTGSMLWAINNVKSNINAVVDQLKADNVDVRLGLVGFKDITYDGLYSTKDYGWFTNVDDFKNAVGALYASGGGDWEESDVDGLEVSREKGFRLSVSKYIVLLTDASYKNGTAYDPELTMDSEISRLKNDNISVSVITDLSDSTVKDAYEPLYTQTNGIIADIYSIFVSVLQPLIEKMSTVSNEGAWIRLSNGSIVHLDKDPSLGDYSVDTDKDGIPDLKELIQEVDDSYVDPSSATTSRYKEWTFKSNPAVADTDGDGIGDKYDKRLTIFDSRVIEQNDDYVLFSTGNKWEKFSFNYYDLMNEISKMSWSNIDDQGYGKKLAPYFDNDKINFSTEELNYIYDYDPMGVRSYLTANQHHSLVEDVYRVRTHVPSLYYKYDSFTEKWSLTEETRSDFGDNYKVFSTAELMFTYDTQTKMNIDDLFDIVNRIVAVGMFFVGEFNPSALEKAGEEYGVKAAEDLVFTGSNEVMLTVEPELQGLSEDALEAVNAVEEKELVNLLNASDETEIETIKAEMLANAKGAAEAAEELGSIEQKLASGDPEAIFEDVYDVIQKGDEYEVTLKDQKTVIEVSESQLETDLVEKQGVTSEEAKGVIECFGDGCFVGETLIQTSNGLKRIDTIQEGDLVLSKDVKTGEMTYKPVLTVYRKSTKRLIVLNVQGQEIRTTPSHLFFVDGWWKSAENLKVGDKILTSAGDLKEVTATTTENQAEPERIYNLNVGDYHTYFVSGLELLVHNDCNYREIFFNKYPNLEGKVWVHHSIERQVLTKYPGLFTEAELNDISMLRGIPKDVNSELHLSTIRTLWNQFYEEIDAGEIPLTKQSFYDKVREIDAIFGSAFQPPI